LFPPPGRADIARATVRASASHPELAAVSTLGPAVPLDEPVPLEARAGRERPLAWIAFAAVAAAASYLLARELALGPPPGPYAYWPMYGVMVGILFRRPAREWAALVVVAAAAQVATIYLVRGDLAGGATPVGALAGFAQAALSVAILRRWAPASPLSTPRGMVWFVAVAVTLVPLAVTPLTGLAFAWGLGLPFGATWAPLFAGNSLGALLFAPPFLCALPARRVEIAWDAHPAEIVLCQAATLAVTLLTFSAADPWVRFVALPYALFPFLAWSALRCGPRPTWLAVVGVATIAAWCTARGLGPFAVPGAELNQRVLGVQAYLAFVAFTGLVLTAFTEERRQAFAEAALRDSVQRGFLDSSDHVLALTDLEGRLVLANQAAQAAFGGGRGDLVGRNAREVLAPEDAATSETDRRRVLERGVPLTFQETLLANGERRPFEVTRFPVRDHNGAIRYLGMIARDATLQRELASRMEGAQRVEVLGRLAAGVAHDLNNLLTLLVGNAGLLLEEPGRSAEDVDMLREMSTAGAEAAKLTARLMALGRGNPSAGDRVVPLDAVVRELEPLLRVLARGNVDVDTRLGAAGAHVRADPTALEQVVLNLVSNARDAITGEGRITLTTATHERDGERWVRLAVSDTGAGMDRATLERVFEPFFTTKENRGTGIGLYTVAAIVRQAGGEIAATSEPGAGTTFLVDLPVTEPPADA
jgi:PAS domain S-box-containing protein